MSRSKKDGASGGAHHKRGREIESRRCRTAVRSYKKNPRTGHRGGAKRITHHHERAEARRLEHAALRGSE